MYGADWCGDCVRAKKFFADNHVDYLWIDLEKDENKQFGETEVLRRNNGKKSIPVIVFDDDSHLTEPTNAQLAEMNPFKNSLRLVALMALTVGNRLQP